VPDVAPPKAYRPKLHRHVLPAGTELWRVTPAEYASTPFNPFPVDDPYEGGRFDATGGAPFPYCYAGFTRQTAALEALVRSIPFRNDGDRVLPRDRIRGRVLTCLQVEDDLPLVALRTSTDLAAACQDAWLVHADEREYSRTRRWGEWLREYTEPTDAGLIWPSKRDVGADAVMLYGDRCGGQVRPAPSPVISLDDDAGARLLSECLAPLRVTVRPPRKR
jgi:hypothetical protein